MFEPERCPKCGKVTDVEHYDAGWRCICDCGWYGVFHFDRKGEPIPLVCETAAFTPDEAAHIRIALRKHYGEEWCSVCDSIVEKLKAPAGEEGGRPKPALTTPPPSRSDLPREVGDVTR